MIKKNIGYLWHKIMSAIVIGMAFFSAGMVFASETRELNIWTWGIYCPDFATTSFEAKYGIKVNCTFYHGNEELWAKLHAGHEGVDIIQPSNHMIHRFAKAGLLAPTDTYKIPNYAGLSEGFKKADYNIVNNRQYSVPYTFGIMGLA
ncbi:MAG: extracellular solute-binding protein, partial [Deltaproteobacteria bacterium]|nr:extracellular solute-binding protein [Deltaproteobacteria bacterium]